ncbi:(2Fe-2S)-binding protein [Salinisphaera sp. LB1]|uniref:(2Fe-2S)-binding protein n=1 Tax=Salinisphaera sp. LB1 TaxID=2183911 RepID=UPI000D705FEF|nr:(2Fe-2S)-binding protein [Salinisphaera sp. LB1]
MYVCVCNAVTDCQIRQAYCEGACSMRLLRQKLGVAGCCGRCAPCARDLLVECRQERDRAEAIAAAEAPAAATA